MIRILIADDHALVRNGLDQWLSSIEDLEVVGLASNGREAVDLACELLPDIVLMDLSMPVMDGITAMSELATKAPQVSIIALTTTGDPQQVNAALDAGAMGYMLKDVEPEVLVANIRAVAVGGLALSPSIAANLFKAGRGPRAIYDSLTPREQEILLLIAAGNPNKQIGRALGISDKTVKAHCGRIFQRLGVRDRTQAAVWVMRIAPNESDSQ
ncbi:MAG: response regulator transcription factor [Actinomycetota bacterium]